MDGFAVGNSSRWTDGRPDGESDACESTAVGIDVDPSKVGTCEGASDSWGAVGVLVLRRKLGACVGVADAFAEVEGDGTIVEFRVSFDGDVALRQMLARSS
jgi:hypothetical protein